MSKRKKPIDIYHSGTQLSKYMSITALNKVIENGFLLSSPLVFNDAFETSDLKKADDYRIFCVTRCKESKLMWGYYGNEGCRIVIDKKKYLDAGVQFEQVKYDKYDNRLKVKDDYHKLIHKSISWEHEKEHRVIINVNELPSWTIKDGDCVFLKGKYISHIYFGIDIKDSKQLLEVLNLLHNDKYKKVELHKIEKSKNAYRLISTGPLSKKWLKDEIARLEELDKEGKLIDLTK